MFHLTLIGFCLLLGTFPQPGRETGAETETEGVRNATRHTMTNVDIQMAPLGASGASAGTCLRLGS